VRAQQPAGGIKHLGVLMAFGADGLELKAALRRENATSRIVMLSSAGGSAAARWSRRGCRSVIQYSSYQRGFTGKGDIGCLH
jgi:hypothetical protein